MQAEQSRVERRREEAKQACQVANERRANARAVDLHTFDKKRKGPTYSTAQVPGEAEAEAGGQGRRRGGLAVTVAEAVVKCNAAGGAAAAIGHKKSIKRRKSSEQQQQYENEAGLTHA